jgi:single-strand DNA-binding protein
MSTNVAVVVGTLARAPELRHLPSGGTVLGLEVTVRSEVGPAETVNVAWYDAPVAAERWGPGEELLVSGRTRRRFFQAGGATQSRTELVATIALPTRRAAAARSALEAASERIVAALDG